jgi:hypothetical protein
VRVPLIGGYRVARTAKADYLVDHEIAASHEHWVAEIDGKFRKVTVDCQKAPFSPDLIGSMAKQAGVTKKQVYEIHFSM